MPITKIMRGLPADHLAAEGLMYHDACLTPCQRECSTRLGISIQLEQEAYMTKHLEVKAMMELFVSKMTRQGKRKDILKEAGQFFTKPLEKFNKQILKRLGHPGGAFTMAEKPPLQYEDSDLINDLKDIVEKHYPPEPWTIQTPYASTPNTPSSSFLSIVTSDTTIPTPEPVPPPEPTLFELFYVMVSDIIDGAIYSQVTDSFLRYDTAYVEVKKCVEQAMEIPVIEIREDIAELYYEAYSMFEKIIMEKERIAAEIEWEKRMRKKLKRTLRRLDNFKGYVTPPTPKSVMSSHESYKKPPPKPCVCHPTLTYNRYPKDRFGIYLPRTKLFRKVNTTVTPAISMENIANEPVTGKEDTNSALKKK